MREGGCQNMTYETGLNATEKVALLFQPDVLLPAQYLETCLRKAHLEPEKRLMLTVLEDAVWCFQKYIFARDRKGKGLFRDAEGWILDENSDRLFSFDNICEALGLNPPYVREGLVRWKKKKVIERRKAKIYRLAPRLERNKPGLELSRTAEEGLQQVAGR